jgi:hypothetical protein
MSLMIFKRLPGSARLAPWVGATVIAIALSGPAATATATARPEAASSAAAGGVYGGVTPQSWPVVVEVSRNGRQVIRAVIGLDLQCSSGDSFSESDNLIKLKINKRRRFSATYGPVTTRNNDGSTTDFADSVRGAANTARTTVSGTWELTEKFFNAGGALTDTCKSGTVHWRVKQ